jgi:uncharacterized membrane protein
MPSRPSYSDYVQHLPKLIFSPPADFGMSDLKFADRPLLLFSQIPIIAAVWFIYDISPWSVYRGEWVARSSAALLGVLLVLAYWFFFVYRFARFEWQAEAPAQTEVPLAPQAEKAFRVKSRAAFALLFLLASAVMAAYALLGYGLAPQRLFSQHKAELYRLSELLDHSDTAYINPPHIIQDDAFIGVRLSYVYAIETGTDRLSDAETARIKNLINAIGPNYILEINKYSLNSLWINLDSHFGRNPSLVWLRDAEKTPPDSWVRLDDHWWLTD